MEENHSIEVVFPDGMPYLWSLARRYGYASDWTDIGHPSLPNYLAILGGSAFDKPADCSPSPGCTYPGPTVFGQALSRGEAAESYEESMAQPCDVNSSGEYDVNHNPWAYFPSETVSCKSGDLPAGTVAAGALVSDVRGGSLPTVGMITPNLSHDGHNGTLAQADAWLRAWIPVLMSGPDWRAGRLAIVVVFDEGEAAEPVPFVLLAPGLSGVRVSVPVNHYALTRLLDQFIGAPPLRQAKRAADITSLFGLARLPGRTGSVHRRGWPSSRAARASADDARRGAGAAPCCPAAWLPDILIRRSFPAHPERGLGSRIPPYGSGAVESATTHGNRGGWVGWRDRPVSRAHAQAQPHVVPGTCAADPPPPERGEIT